MSNKMMDTSIEQLANTNVSIRRDAIRILEGMGPTARPALASLWSVAALDARPHIRHAAVRAIITISEDQAALLQQALDDLAGDDPRRAHAAIDILIALHPTHTDTLEALDKLWHFLQHQTQVDLLDHAFRAIAELTSDSEVVVQKLIDHDQLETWKKSHLIVFNLVRDGLNHLWPSQQEAIMPLLVGALESDEENIRQRALERLIDKANQLSPAVSAMLYEKLVACIRRHGQGLAALRNLAGEAAIERVIADQTIAPEKLGQLLFEELPDFLNEKWRSGQDNNHLLALLLAALENQQWLDRCVVSDWLQAHINELSGMAYDQIINRLDQQVRQEDDADIRGRLGSTLDQLKMRREQNRRATEMASLLIQLRTGDDDSQAEAINQLVKMGTRGALRALIQEWVQWIIFGEHALLIEEAAEKMRKSCVAVLPLVDQLEQTDETLKDWIKKRLNAAQENQLLDEAELDQRRSFIDSEQFRAHVRIVRRRVSGQLADMSDPRFYEGVEDIYQVIQNEMNKHVVVVLASQLPEELDFETREKLARTLGNLGNAKAVDALVNSIVDRERTRTDRQTLLDKYYLEPSKRRSEETAKMVQEAIVEAKRTLWVLQGLNGLLFLGGLALIGVGVYITLTNEALTSRLIGLASSLGGVAGIVTIFLKDPLNRIQHAMANLVQLEAAFTSFIWELNLNATYIQSQYVAEGILTDQEIAQTVNRIEVARRAAMNLVAVHTKDRGQRLVTRLHRVSPAAGELGGQITLHGQYLQGDAQAKRDTSGLIAINHRPVQVNISQWDDHQVSFELPATLAPLANGEQGVWISLFVDGMETNALPFHFIMGQ